MNEIELKRRAEAERAAGPIRKMFEVKADTATLTENKLAGNASVLGVMDRGQDCIFPGAYSKCLKQFLVDGFIPIGHAWDSLPVAMPTKAKEDGQNLYCEATFHSTQAAQDARTVCMERLSAGLSVGLSVGFMPDYDNGVAWFEDGVEAQGINAGVIYFDSGDSMLKFAKSAGYDMSLFDLKGIKACKGYCRGILSISELYEFSIVAIPMNQQATLTDAKSAWHRNSEGVTVTGIWLRAFNADVEVLAEVKGEWRLLIHEPYISDEGVISHIIEPLGIDRAPADYLGMTPDLFSAKYPDGIKAHFPHDNVRDFERFLREAGYPNSQAKAIASKGFNFAQREVAESVDQPTPTLPPHQKYLAGMYRRSQLLREV